MGEYITITYRLDRADYVRATRFYLRKSGVTPGWYIPLFALVVALVGVMVYYAGVTPIAVTVLVVAAVAAAGILAVYLVGPGRRYDRTPALWIQAQLRFSVEDIAFQTEEGAGILPWGLARFWISPTDYYLIRTRQDYLIVPKEFFPDDEARCRFETLVVQANPEAACRRFSRPAAHSG